MAVEIKNLKVGDTFTAKEEVDRYRAIFYAGASGDFNPIHIDPEFGQMVGLGGVILHGLCTLAFTANAITNFTGDPGMLKKYKCRFAKPVHLADIITTEATVTAVQNNAANISLKVTNQEGVEVLTMIEAEIG
jgi:3-hydroxybutyryl-CoA dehydratase